MDKQLQQLTKLAKKYDEESNFKQADEITELMIKIAQLNLPTPIKPVEEKGIFQNLKDATGQGLQYLGKGIGSAAQSVGGAVSSAAGVIAKPFKTMARANEILKSMPAYQARRKQQYEVDIAIKTILERTYNEALANEFTVEEARQKAKRLGDIEKSNNTALDANSIAIYKTPFSEFLDLRFDTYAKDKIADIPLSISQ